MLKLIYGSVYIHLETLHSVLIINNYV